MKRLTESRITKLEKLDHPLEVRVTFDCGHTYIAIGLYAVLYKRLSVAPCEICLRKPLSESSSISS